MRRFIILLLVALVALPVVVQGQDRPAGLQPLPEPLPPPAGLELEGDLPQVSITKRGADRVEEHRVNGKLYMLKVTPPHGVSYYLVDHNGDDTWSRFEHVDGSFRPPMWVIGTF